MQINNDSIIGIADGANKNDVPSMQQSAMVYVNGSTYVMLPPLVKNITTTSGSATMYLTDTGLVGGNAIFTNVISVTIVPNSTSSFPATSYSLSGVTLTVNATQQNFNVISLLSTSLIGSMTVGNVPNGTAFTVTVIGTGNAI